VLPVGGGAVRFDDADISDLTASQAVRLGISLVPEGRRLFPSLSVEENLQIGGYSGRRGSWRLAEVYDLFPRLAERRRHMGTALSGGEQQMVAIGRALMSNPRLLLCDELSLGLAPIVIQDIYTALPRIRDAGTSLVIVEQDIAQAMRVADRVYCLQEGRITLTGRPAEFSREAIHAAYFGA
jgi:branched-chain amino acid transport system ATP-binding protein